MSDNKGEKTSWLGTWASSQQGLDPTRGEYPPAPFFANNTFRQTIRISVGGTSFRFLFSNEYGETPLEFNSVHIAKPGDYGTPIILPETDMVITFEGGQEKVTIPAGGFVYSDILTYDAADLERFTITIHFGAVPQTITSHTGARTTTYLVSGNHVTDVTLENPATKEVWYFLTAIDVLSDEESRSVACIGDSTTDGRGVRTNYYDRWTDVLAERLLENAKTTNVAVLNQGIGGNAIGGGLGPAANLRYARDTVEQTKVGYVIVFEGVNDIGFAESIDRADWIIDNYIEFAELAHKKGVKIFGGTIMPFGGFTDYNTKEFGDLREHVRLLVNDWIRTSSLLDGYVDFDAAVRDPENPRFLDQVCNSGDGLHPSVQGYLRMGNCIDLSLFEQ